MHVLPGLFRLVSLIFESGFHFNLLSVKRSIKEPSGELTCFLISTQILRRVIDEKIMTGLIPTLAF